MPWRTRFGPIGLGQRNLCAGAGEGLVEAAGIEEDAGVVGKARRGALHLGLEIGEVVDVGERRADGSVPGDDVRADLRGTGRGAARQRVEQRPCRRQMAVEGAGAYQSSVVGHHRSAGEVRQLALTARDRKGDIGQQRGAAQDDGRMRVLVNLPQDRAQPLPVPAADLHRRGIQDADSMLLQKLEPLADVVSGRSLTSARRRRGCRRHAEHHCGCAESSHLD